MRLRSEAGFTLIELMVAVGIAIFLTMAAVAFARHETKLMGISTDRLEMQQSARAALDMLADDIGQAGAGVGYGNASGNFGLVTDPLPGKDSFAGVRIDNFCVESVDGVGTRVCFNQDGTPIAYPGAADPGFAGTDLSLQTSDINTGAPRIATPYTLRTVDIGILSATGSYSTVADFAFGAVQTGQYCNDGDISFRDGELALIRNDVGDAARAILVQAPTAAACSYGQCLGGCTSFTVGTPPAIFYQNDASADSANFVAGELHGGLHATVWFVDDSDPSYDAGIGVLRRAWFDDARGCAARDSTCGDEVMPYVDTLQATIWEWDQSTQTWVNSGQEMVRDRTGQRHRLRVDLELVVRAKADSRTPRDALQLRLAPLCVPNFGSCPASKVDFTERQAYRTSIEVKNSGYMAVQ
ncbi:MAG: prepilin-type N-terminal cleavage/methylation domain-containing protein [Deltaproteobacteria bacterium]|nr:prepilin-type N-terminal cleavage/methylation domain-containing protein [Deltaproteobacteria bacterium]